MNRKRSCRIPNQTRATPHLGFRNTGLERATYLPAELGVAAFIQPAYIPGGDDYFAPESPTTLAMGVSIYGPSPDNNSIPPPPEGFVGTMVGPLLIPPSGLVNFQDIPTIHHPKALSRCPSPRSDLTYMETTLTPFFTADIRHTSSMLAGRMTSIRNTYLFCS